MDLAFYPHPMRVYASPSTECLLQRPGGPRFATQELDMFGDPYVVGLQVGFRRRSLGTHPSFDDQEQDRMGPVARRWSLAALEVKKAISRRASHPTPTPASPAQARETPQVSERRHSFSMRRASDSPHLTRPELPNQPEEEEEAQAQAHTKIQPNGEEEDAKHTKRERRRVHKWFSA